MALTKAQIAWCTAIFAAGTVTPVTVQKVHKTVSAKPKKGPGKAAAPRAVVNLETVRPAPQPIMDCPLPSVGGFDESLEYRLDPLWANPHPPLFDTGGDVVWGGASRPPSVVPEADLWVTLIAGFGFVGLSLRRKSRKVSA